MRSMVLYFAYGSNMNPARMAKRCPGAITLGRAKLPHYRLAERLYADIEFEEESELHGVLYCITENHLSTALWLRDTILTTKATAAIVTATMVLIARICP